MLNFYSVVSQEIESVAEGLDLSVELKHKKINISNSRVCIVLFMNEYFLDLCLEIGLILF